VPFEAWHLDWIDFNIDAFQSMMRLPCPTADHAKALATFCDAYTGLREGKVVACAGIMPLWNGVADLWMYLGKETFTDKRLACKVIKYYLDDIIKRHDIHRFQAVVKADYCKGIRFAEFFGFKAEGIMKAFGPNKEDFIRYARVL
tara:strand:+ start:582 stop:1016 length:435 start_codon:yes stop_codon:yes gene_type:complete